MCTYRQNKDNKFEWTRQLTARLINELENNQILYSINHEHYTNKERRAQAYDKIYASLKDLAPNITEEDIKKKIHTLRSQYSKELRIKSKERKTEGATYIPKLWCFDQLDFLKPYTTARRFSPNFLHESNTSFHYSSPKIAYEKQLQQVESDISYQFCSPKKSYDTLELEKLDFVDCVDDLYTNELSSSSLEDKNSVIEIYKENSHLKKRARSKNMKIATTDREGVRVFTPSLDSLEKTENLRDESAIYADCWACIFRKLTPLQQIYAKQAIDEILTRGQLEQLTLNYVGSIPCTENGR